LDESKFFRDFPECLAAIKICIRAEIRVHIFCEGFLIFGATFEGRGIRRCRIGRPRVGVGLSLQASQVSVYFYQRGRERIFIGAPAPTFFLLQGSIDR
jgi:hypothetical protein